MNNVNGISELIPVEPNSIYSLIFVGNENNSITANFIVKYDENKEYLGFQNLGVNGTFQTNNATHFVRYNPNSSDGFDKLINGVVIAKSNEFPFGYLNYGESKKKYQGDLAFYKKQNFISSESDSTNNVSINNNILTIPSGERSFHGKRIFSFLFGIEYTGKARICIKITCENRELLGLITDNSEVLLNNASSKKLDAVYYEGQNKNEYFIIADGEFNKNDGILFYKNSGINYFLENEISAKIDLYILYLDENGKPRNLDGATKEQINTLSTQIQNVSNSVPQTIANQVPAIVQQQIGSGLNDYLSTHIDDFTFLQPNYIQANSGFNFASLNSAMNGKFISVIQDIDLQGATIDFVAQNVKNLKLVFNGGRILNGKIRSNYTRCIFNSNEAFVNVEILNQFQNDYALPEWFGAKIDGSTDDSFAINQSLKFSSKVRLVGNRTMLVKKPIILRSGNYLEADGNFEVKLGDYSNCTLLKNENIDIPIDAVGNVTYPTGFKRNFNITVSGGIWNGNALKQNRANNPIVGDQPDVIGTAQFPDDDTRPYFGAMMKFADIDNFLMKDIILRDARTYQIAAGGLNHFKFHNILMERSFHLENQDGIHLHGNCFDGDFDNISGTAGDDLIAITTSEASALSVRVGDVKKIRIRNVYNYGFAVGASPSSPKFNHDGFNPDTQVSRPVRLTYTDHIIDDILVENVIGYLPNFVSIVVISHLPLVGFSGNNGKVGTVKIENIKSEEGCIGIDIGANTKIDHIILRDLKMKVNLTNEVPAIIKPLENFSGDSSKYALNEIGNITVDNVCINKGNSYHSAPDGLFFTLGKIKNLIIDKLIVEDDANSPSSFDALLSGDIGFVSIANSKISVDNIFSTNGNSKSNTTFREINNEFGSYINGVYNAPSSFGFVPKRVNCESVIVPTNPTNPKIGDKILKSDGIYLFTNAWNKL